MASHSILESLNDAQQRAVTSQVTTVAIQAGPGSGKTHTLASRVVWLIDHVGYQPEDVIVATFTVKAAREMQERIGRALGNGREKKIVLGTFHSIARRYLATYGRNIGLSHKFGIADDNDSKNIITRICKRLKLALDTPAARAWISKRKAGGTADETKKPQKLSAGLQELHTCYDEYQKQLKLSNLLDYDDLLVRCVELLRKFPSCVANIQTVLIDEYQDTNGIQYELMKLLGQHCKRITVVGDPDQSIYGWRSAEIRNLWRFLDEFPGTDEVSLEENYRSSKSILSLSLAVIQQDSKRYKKLLKPTHTSGSRPVLRRLKSGIVEAEWIVSEIRRTILMTGNMLVHSDVAILLRTAALSRHIESALGKAGIPYRMVGGFKFYDRAEIKTLLDYLRVIHQPENNDALGRIMNVPRRGIGDGTVKNLIEEAERGSMSLWALLSRHCQGKQTAKTRITKPTEQKISGEIIRNINEMRKQVTRAMFDKTSTPFTLVDLIQQLLKAINFEKHLKDTHPDDHEQRWANVQEFVNLAADFARDMEQTGDETLPKVENLEHATDADVLARFLSNVALAADAQTGKQGDNKPLVTISTIHAAKGLEWPIVFIPAVYNGSIPHMRSEDNDEERRLLYVAMTRAQSLLYLSCPNYSSNYNSNYNSNPNELSPFVTALGNAFAKKGPCFDQSVVEQIAKIVRRPAPSQKAIYASIKSIGETEDNLYPIDPDGDQASGGDSHGGGRPRDALHSKRQRISGPGTNYQDEKEPEWRRGYTTTMEQASNFTMRSLPGFINAGEHQAAINAANAAAQAKTREDAAKRKRQAGQQSILGFVKSGAQDGGPNQPPPMATGPSTSRHEVNRFAAQRMVSDVKRDINKPAIDPQFLGHRITAPKLPGQINRPRSPRQWSKYTFPLSSPEPKPAPQDKGTEDKNEPPPEPTRPAACLHVTTCNMPLGQAAQGGLRKPSLMGINRIQPISRPQKPFRPLTIKGPNKR